jgi:hypothetical protein
VTVHSTGPAWFRTLMHVCNVPIFRRVQTVSLHGPQYNSDLLPHLARFGQLQELELVNTFIDCIQLDAWKEQHPHVAVSVQGP